MAYTERRYELSDLTEVGGATSLTNNGSATFTAGKVGDAATFVAASSQYLSVNDAEFNSITTEQLTMWGWFKLNSLGINHGICGQGTSSYHCHVVATNKLRFRINRSTGGTLSLDYSGTLTTGTWYFFVVEFDLSNSVMSLEINRTGRQTVAVTSGLVGQTTDWSIGSIGSGNFCDGQVDAIGFRRGGLLSGMEKDFYYDAGTGRSHADVDTIRASEPYVYQEFRSARTSNGTSSTTPVANLVEGHIITVVQQIDGDPTDIALAAWDGAWNNDSTALASQAGTTFCRQNVWSKTVTATDVSGETSIDLSWTGSQEDTVLVQVWANCGGINAINVTGNTTAATTHTAPAVTTDVDGCRIQALFGINASCIISGLPSGLDPNGEFGTNTNDGQVVWYGSELQASLGSTGTYALTTSASESSISLTMAMEPAAAGTVTADLALTDGADQIAAAASPFIGAALALTDGADELAITASPFVNVNLSITDGADQIAATVTVVDDTITVSLSLVDGADIIAAVGGPLVAAALTLVDGADIIAGAGGALVTASVTLTDGADLIAAILSDPNNTIADIELSARPLVGITLTASPLMQITLTARPNVE